MTPARIAPRAGRAGSPRAVLLALVCALSGPPARAQRGARDGQWPSYAADAGSTKYSTLDQIDRRNVSRLAVAWTWTSPDEAIVAANERLRVGSFEATPLLVDGVLYVTTPLNLAAAIDAETGRTRWVYDPESYEQVTSGPNKGFIHRGVAVWPAPDGTAETNEGGALASEGAAAPPRRGEPMRVLYAAADAFLVALDARTGAPIPTFGAGGRVDLAQGLRRPVARRGYGVNSPVLVCGDVVIVGSTISDVANRLQGTPGDVRGFDVRTGKQLWTFHTIPQEGEPGVETWEDGSWRTTGSANVWAPMSADLERGLAYLPVSTPNNDYYGGHRLGSGLYGESLVCVECATGRRRWHFQMVHHGVWDYDLPAAPNLVDIEVGGRWIAAVAQVSKQGFTYVFDRVTGEPVWPIEERPVPASTVPGERLSPTQPFPTKPPPFERQGVTVNDVIDLTPELRAEALAVLDRFDHGPLYTPPSERGTLVLPGYGGGANWGGACFDPETGLLYVPSITYVSRFKLIAPDPTRSEFRYVVDWGIEALTPSGWPLVKPPWARITALDLSTGELVWQAPHGRYGARRAAVGEGPPETRALRASLVGQPLGTGGTGSCLVTKTLLFAGIARSSRYPAGGDPLLVAYDKATGEVVAEIPLRTNVTGAPMTYNAGGRQYLVVAIGGGDIDRPSELVALALPGDDGGSS